MKAWHANGLLLCAAIIWGSAFVPQAWGAVDVGPFLFTGLRFFLGALVVLPFAWREWHQLSEVTTGQDAAHAKQHLWPIAGLGLLIFFGVVMQQIGLASTSVTNAGVLTALYVPLTPLLGWLIYRQKPHWIVWPCAIGCLVGSWLLAGGGGITVATGDWWVLFSSIFWALHLLFVGRVANRAGGPFVLSFIQFAVCAVASLGVAAVIEPWVLASLVKAAPSIAYTGFISVGIAYTLQVVGQRHAHAAHAAIILSSETLFAALFGAVFMGDRLSTLGMLGCGLILTCIVVVQFQPSHSEPLTERIRA